MHRMTGSYVPNIGFYMLDRVAIAEKCLGSHAVQLDGLVAGSTSLYASG